MIIVAIFIEVFKCPVYYFENFISFNPHKSKLLCLITPVKGERNFIKVS